MSIRLSRSVLAGSLILSAGFAAKKDHNAFVAGDPAALSPGHAKTKRIADSDKVVHGGGGKPDSHVQIELLPRSNLISRSEVQKVARSPGLRKIARVFGKRVPSLG